MEKKWVKRTGLTGIYVKTRKGKGIKKDICIKGEYMVQGKRVVSYFGWESEINLSPEKCSVLLQEYKTNYKNGIKPIKYTDELKEKLKEKQKRDLEKKLQKQSNIKIDDFWNEVYFPKISLEKKPITYKREIDSYKHHIKQILKNVRINNFNKSHIEKVYYTGKQKGLSIKTCQMNLIVLKSLYQCMVDEGYINKPYPKFSKNIKHEISYNDNKRIRFLNDTEMDILLNELKNRSEILHNIVLLSYHTGMRFGEIKRLNWNDVNFNTGIITLTNTKMKNKTRFVYMTEKVKIMLKNRHTNKIHNTLVFPSNSGKVMYHVSNTYFDVVNQLGFNDGVTDNRYKVVFHTLRHSYASKLVQNGVSLYKVKELMGHSSITMTERYSHLSPHDLKETTKIFE